jgi:O-antigen/teichoic acid export membrane protein
MMTARILGPAGRGESAAIGLWPQFLALVMSLGLPTALLYNLKRYPEDQPSSVLAALLLGTGLGILATGVGSLLLPLWLAQYSPAIIQAGQWLMIAAPVVLLMEIFRAFLEAREEFNAANQLRYLPSLCTLFILCGLAFSGRMTPFTAALAYWLPGIPILLWMFTYLRQFFKSSPQGIQFNLNELGTAYKRLLSYGVRCYGVDLLTTLSLQVDQALVVNLLTPASMGMYIVALSLSRILSVFQASIITVLLPKAAARSASEVVLLTGQAMRISTALALLAGIVLMMAGPMLLGLLYGSEYLGAVPVFRVLMIEVILSGATMVLAQTFMALGKPGIVTILQSVGLGLSIPMMLILIPMYGLVGASFALLGSTIARLIFVLACYPLLLKVDPPHLFLTKEDWDLLRQRVLAKSS